MLVTNFQNNCENGEEINNCPLIHELSLWLILKAIVENGEEI